MEGEVLKFRNRTGSVLAFDRNGRIDAPTVVLLHGGGQTRHSWHNTMRDLAACGYQVMAYDARGHGESDWVPDGDYSIAAMADDLEDLLADSIGPVALVGASMGGVTAFYAIGRSNRRIADVLIMVDITLRPAQDGLRKILDFMRSHGDGFASIEEAADAVAAYNPQRPRPADPSGLRKNLRERHGRLYWHWDPRVIQITPTSEPPDVAPDLIAVSGGVTQPTMLVRGGRSDIVDDASVAEMVRLVPQTRVVDVANAGHMVAGDKNDAFGRAIIDFLQHHMPVTSVNPMSGPSR